MTEARFASILEGFSQVSVAVVGDYFLDKYLIIDPDLTEPSLETGLDAFQVVDRRISPGAAGTVVSNLHALGVGAIHAVGVTGQDGEGFELRQGLSAWDVDMQHLLEHADVFTPTYTKPMIKQPEGGEEESNRIDIVNRDPLPEEIQRAVIEGTEACLAGVDAVIIADQVEDAALGVITPQVRATLCEMAQAHPGCVFFADSRAHIEDFSNMLIKPNQREGARAAGIESDAGDEAIAAALYKRTGRPVFLTLGDEGMVVYDGSDFARVPAYTVSGLTDIVGAGDSATAGIVPAICSGASPAEAAVFGNIAASITVQQIGTTGTASPQQMRERFVEYTAAYGSES